ncbi:MAG: glycosyltransferase [Bacteroidetes bacterium]|nr:glycosyltransferase [Bacteroidota bacterium]
MPVSLPHFRNALQEKRYYLRRKIFGYPFVKNANKVPEREGSLRALLVFLSEPFIMSPSNSRFENHQNLKQTIHIARSLGEAGFVVDVCDVHARRDLPKQKYNLILSHRVDFAADELLAEGGIKVYLATGMNHEVYNRNLRLRYARLNSRRTCDLKPEHLNDENMPFVRSADAVTGFGNEYTAGTWSGVTSGPVKPFNNYGTFSGGFIERDWTSAKRNFLFYAGRLQMVRGLDLLLESFARNPDLHLYICSGFKHEVAFCKCYEKELFHTRNIHAIGLVSKREERFHRIVRECGFVILPSCSDCQPGSVIEAMHSGLIPLVTKETGLDVRESGAVFPSDDEKDIEETMLQLSSESTHRLGERSRKAHELVIQNYSEDKFLERWRQIAHEFAADLNTQL